MADHFTPPGLAPLKKYFLLGFRKLSLPSSIPLGILVISLLGTFFIWRYVSSEQMRIKFEKETDAIELLIKNRINQYIDELYSARAFFAASTLVTRSEWHAYIETSGILNRFPGVAGVHYIKRIPSSQRALFTARVRTDASLLSEGHPTFTIWPESVRDEYFIVTYVEPLLGNEALLGFDMQAHSSFWEALGRARDSGEPTITHRGVFSPDRDFRESVVLITMPMYQKGMPTTTEEDRLRFLEGFLVMAVRTENLLSNIIQDQGYGGIDFAIFEGEVAAPERLLFNRVAPLRSGAVGAGLHATTPLAFAGSVWSIYFTTVPTFGLDPSQHRLTLLVLFLGAIFSFLLFGISYALATSHTHAVQLAKRLTREVGESEAKHRALLNAIPDLILRVNKRGVLLDAKAAKDFSLGIVSEDLTGRNVFEVLPGLDEQLMRYAEQTFRTGESQLFEYVLPVHGVVRTYEARVVASGTEEILVIVRDITERAQAEEKLKARTDELERLNKLMIGRELKMMELKNEITTLKKKDVGKHRT